MHLDYERLLEQAGFTLAAGPLRAMFVLEGITDPAAQYEAALCMIARTVEAMQALTRPRTFH